MQTFDSYRSELLHVTLQRRDGVLEARLRSDDHSLEFDGYVDEEVVRAFRAIGDDPEFCTRIRPDGFDFFTPSGFDKILREGTQMLQAIFGVLESSPLIY